MKKLFLIIFIIHFSIAMWILSIGEMTAYLLFNIWEIPVFYWIESLHPRSGATYSIQDFVVAGIGALFWGLFFVGFRWIVKEIAGRIDRKTDPFRATKIGKTSLAGSGELTLKEPLKFGEAKVLKTKPYFFDMQMKSTSVIFQNKGEVLSQALEGTRYTGYHVFIYDDKNILVAEINDF